MDGNWNMKVSLFCGIVGLIMTGMSCDQALPVLPARIDISKLQIKSTIGTGSKLQQISNLYVYSDEVFSGAFRIPAKISFLQSGEKNIRIFPGIIENGIGQTPIIYPFMSDFNTVVEFVPGNIILLEPTFEYSAETKFRLIDEFEGETQFDLDLDGDTLTHINYTPGIEGLSGHVVLSDSNPSIEIASSSGQRGLPLDGRPIFLEMHYKNDVDIQVGLIGWSDSANKLKQFKIVVRPKQEWNKIYINFTSEIQDSQLEFYQIVLKANHLEGMEPSHIFLDNIKWLHL